MRNQKRGKPPHGREFRGLKSQLDPSKNTTSQNCHWSMYLSPNSLSSRLLDKKKSNNSDTLIDTMVFKPRLKRWYQTGDPSPAAAASSSSRKKQWSIFERRPGSEEAGKGDHKSCLKTKRNLRKPAAAKNVTFKECTSDSDGVDSIPSYYSYDDSFIDDSHDDSQHGHQAGCEACDMMLYQPESLPAIYTRDQSDSVLGSRQEEFRESMINDGYNLNEYLNLKDANGSSNDVIFSNACEKVNAGFSTATASLRKSCNNVMLGLCIPDGPNRSNSATSDSQRQHNSELKSASKKTTNNPTESCRSQVSETHYIEGRDEIESSFDELGMTTITNLARVMEAVDDALFPVDTTQFRGKLEEVGKRCSESTQGVNTSNDHSSKSAALTNNSQISKWSPKSATDANINKDVTFVSAGLNNFRSARKWSSKSYKGSNTNVAFANAVVNNNLQIGKKRSKCSEDAAVESTVLSSNINPEGQTDPWIYESTDKMNNEKSVSWADFLYYRTGTDDDPLKTAEHTVSANKFDAVSASKTSKEKTRIVPDKSISSNIWNLFKNETTITTLLGGAAPKPANSIVPVSQWYLSADKREGETNQVQTFTGVRSATCSVPKSILVTEDGESAISSWRDAVADTVEITPRSMKGNIAKPQVHTQQMQDFYPPAMSFNQRQIAPYRTGGRFPPLSPSNHNCDPLQISPLGKSPLRNPLHDHYSHNMNGKSCLWQEPVLTPNSGIINGSPPIPVMSRLPSLVPNINSNLSEVSANEERDRYAGTEQQRMMADQYDQGLFVPGSHPFGNHRTMVWKSDNSYPNGQHGPQPHLFGRISNGQQEYLHPPSSHQVIDTHPCPIGIHFAHAYTNKMPSAVMDADLLPTSPRFAV